MVIITIVSACKLQHLRGVGASNNDPASTHLNPALVTHGVERKRDWAWEGPYKWNGFVSWLKNVEIYQHEEDWLKLSSRE